MSTLKHSASTESDTTTANLSEHENAQENRKSAQKMHRRIKKAVPKTAASYWLSRVRIPAGGIHFSVQIAHQGKRHRFALATAEKSAAAEKARSIYLHLVANGWKATLEHYKPRETAKLKASTVGAFLAEVQATAGFKRITFTTYAVALRNIAAEIAGIGDQAKQDEHGKPIKDRRGRVVYMSRRHGAGHAAWLAAVNAVPLTIFTPAAIQKWKVSYIEAAGTAPDARRRAETTAGSYLRNARSLFSERALEHARAALVLPEPPPFAGVKLPKKGNTAYQSRIDAPELIAAARTELEGAPFKAFCLALLCGLRKGEIDNLTWPQIDFGKGVLRIERTEYFSPKSEDSIGEVDLDPELLALLQGWKTKAKGPFVIESERKPMNATARAEYRCKDTFKKIYAWLKAKGVTARKPLHELRKELGAILASTQGIFAAQSVLRHAQISTTAAYYTDKKKRISAGLGALLTAPASNVVQADFQAVESPANAKEEARA